MDASRSTRIALWETGDYAPLGEAFAQIHAQLLDACEPLAGLRLLDVATGTGGVALGAAERGAAVVGVDFAPAMVRGARERAAAASLDAVFVEADAESLPFPDASFDVVTSCFGMVFAPDSGAVARELARVCRPGGRLAYTVWLPVEQEPALFDGLPAASVGLEADAKPWRDEDAARALLGPAFDISFERELYDYAAASAAELWQFLTAHAPPFAAYVEGLAATDRQQLQERFSALAAPEADGLVHDRADYLRVVGTRTEEP